jgi:hypothetical protein
MQFICAERLTLHNFLPELEEIQIFQLKQFCA